MPRVIRICTRRTTGLVLTAMVLAGTVTASPDTALHSNYTRLLGTYVHGQLVDYEAWAANAEDKGALDAYVAELSALDPADWPRDEALAYWLNLYNALTVKLILDNYPLDSIKDLGGFMKKSPWKRKLVTVAGRELTLNDIENEIIRPTFGDPRIHFALNCASLGCPPLAAEAYVAARLDEQLDRACRLALNLDRWVTITGNEVRLTKIFDWYAADFEHDGGTVLEFVARYRTEPLPDGKLKVSYLDYDWHLNRTSGSD